MNKISKKQVPIIIKDTNQLNNVIIQVNLKRGTTTVLSNYSAWENLALLMEALATTAEQCVNEGIDRKYVDKAIDDYLKQVLKSYQVISRN